MAKLTAISVRNAKPGRHADGGGLYLLTKPSGTKSWLLRIQADGRRRDIGLGSVDTTARSETKDDHSVIDIPILSRRVLTLSQAREKAAILRAAAKGGLDPLVERDRQRRVIPTFEQAARAAHKALSPGWTDKVGKAFLASLEQHAFDKIGRIRVDAVTAADITAALQPIWLRLPDTARKVRQRIATSLNYAHGQGWRTTESPSTRAVTVSLPRQPKSGNFTAMAYRDVPAFFENLHEQFLTSGRAAIMFQILTAARPGEVRSARWEQLDLGVGEWLRPAGIMKNGIAHTVTLSTAAVQLLRQVKGNIERSADAYVFPGQRGGRLSDMTMTKVLRDASIQVDAHGFRSSFRDWCAEKSAEIPDAVAEAALSHVVADAVIKAYKRTDFLVMRRTLLQAWGEFVTGSAGNVS